MNHLRLVVLLSASTAFGQTFPLTETTGLVAHNVKVDAVEYKGRKAVRLTKDPGDEEGFAVLEGTDFQDGIIEADIALKSNAPRGVRMPGFIGMAFRMRKDASHFELFYLRPGNSTSDDQAMRNHSVQYVSAPDFGWYRLRREWPAVYEAWAELSRETWTPVKIQVAGRVAKLYVNGISQPSLVVDGMKGEDLHGAVALWGYAGEEAYFSNVRITKTPPTLQGNGGEAAGAWQVRFNTDAGNFGGTLRLSRDGNKLTGEWAGDLGEARAVTGTWREGYVEISFAGTWPGEKDSAKVSLGGWVAPDKDGDTANGRMKVEGRADGQWMASRKK